MQAQPYEPVADLCHGVAALLAKPKVIPLRQHLEEVDPGPHLGWWHVGAMVEACQGVLDGDITNLLICAPPRTWKSRTVVQGTSSCRLRNEPRSKVMIACAAADLVLYHSRHARFMAEAAGVALKRDSRAVDLWETVQHGTYKAITVRGARLGFGWDLGVVDDPFASMAQALSRAVQRQTWEWWRDDFQARKQDRPEGGAAGQILMHQRLAKGDTAHRLQEWLEETCAEPWHFLILEGLKTPQAWSLPTCCTLIEDPRQPGEPLCEEPGVMGPIRDRRENNPRLHHAVDQQDPPDDRGGGTFRASWLPLIGEGREDLGSPVEALLAMAAEGLIPKPKRWMRGHDFAAGGADAVASVALCQTVGGAGPEWILFDPTEDHPAVAAVEGMALANATRTDTTAEQAIPKEVGVGAVATASIQTKMQRLGYRVHLMKVGKGKLALAQPLAAAAAPSCRLCARLVVGDHERAAMAASDICGCEDPDVQLGKVAILAGTGAVDLQDELHEFTGEEGGKDNLVDSAAAAFNAATAGSRKRALGAFVVGAKSKPAAESDAETEELPARRLPIPP